MCKRYIINEEIMTAGMRQVIAVNRLIEDHEYSISEACDIVGLSRSAYYKMRDHIWIYKEP